MLVLSRKPGETIVIGDVVVHVSSNRGGKVRIAIDAPEDVVVL
jgi:carbon storage regulator CsrA